MTTDLRDRVEQDRGLLKRIQLHIPGFAGYRRREDIRQADSMLRIQVADRLKAVRTQMESARQSLSENYDMKALEPVGRLILQTQGVEGMIRHAEQGYSGFSAATRVEERELDTMYEFDLAILEGIAKLDAKVRELQAAQQGASVLVIKECQATVEDLRLTFKRRWAVMTGTEVA